MPPTAEAQPSPPRLRLWGGFRLSYGDDDATPRGRKHQGLLAILALSGDQGVRRERLAALLWSDRGEEQARASLRQALAELRASEVGARGQLSVSRESVALRVNDDAIDVCAIRRAADARDYERLGALLDGCGAELLEGLDGLCPGFDDWLRVERSHQQQMLLASCLAAIDAADGAAPPALRGALDALERFDPGNEVVARAGFRLDHRLGDATTLRRRYRRLADLLRREFDAEPSAETRALAETLMRGKDATPAPPVAAERARAPVAQAAVSTDAPPLLLVGEFASLTQGPFDNLGVVVRLEVLAGLSRFRDLRLALHEGDAPPEAYRLVASLRTSGGRLIISPHVTRGGGELVWADRLDVPADDIQPAVETIVGRIVSAVLPALMSDMVATIAPRPDRGLYSRYLVARQASERPPDHATALRAADELEAIAAADPRFVAPKLSLARIYDTDFVWTRAGSSGEPERARALELSRAALALDPDNVTAWTHVGWGYLWHRQWRAAADAFDAALTLSPYNLARLLEVAYGRVFLGDHEGAAALIERGLEIQPRGGDGLFGDRGLLRMMTGDNDGALEDFARVTAPDLSMTIHAAASAALAGRVEPNLSQRAAHAIASIFPGGALPPVDQVVAWIDDCHPFRHDAHRARLLAGVRAALA